MESFIDPRRRRYASPKRIITFDSGDGRIENSQALLRNDISICEIISVEKSKPYVVLDFGEEIHGGISLEISQIKPLAPTSINLRFGESVTEAMEHPNQDHAIHEMDVKIPPMSKQEFGQTGFRFLKITLTEPNSRIEIRNISAVLLEHDWEYKGGFHSSDQLLNDIWSIGARTVHLCCQDYILDGIKRDRLAWMGDIHPQVGVIASVFGNVDIVEKSLNHLCELYPVGSWMNNIASYTLWWIITVWEWYYYTGDETLLESNRKYLSGLIEELSKIVDDYGNIDTGQKKNFLEWASAADDTAVSEGLFSLMLWALNDVKLIAEVLECDELIQKSDAILERLALRKPIPTNSKQVHSLRVLAGTANPSETNKNFLSTDLCDGISPWFGCYALRAKAMAGDYFGCEGFIREYWGGMLKLGATSFWEHFQVDWMENAARIDEIVPPGKKDVHRECGDYCFKGLRHSLCHGWAGNPTAWLSEHVLGIKIMEPGCKTIMLDPTLCDLTDLEGEFPTPSGILKVRYETDDNGKIKSEYEAPKNLKIILADTLK